MKRCFCLQACIVVWITQSFIKAAVSKSLVKIQRWYKLVWCYFETHFSEWVYMVTAVNKYKNVTPLKYEKVNPVTHRESTFWVFHGAPRWGGKWYKLLEPIEFIPPSTAKHAGVFESLAVNCPFIKLMITGHSQRGKVRFSSGIITVVAVWQVMSVPVVAAEGEGVCASVYISTYLGTSGTTRGTSKRKLATCSSSYKALPV